MNPLCSALVAAVLLGPVIAPRAVAVVPRVAVLPQDADATISDLVFERLSRRPELGLVERARLDAMLAEQSLRPLTRPAREKIGRLLKADGLLILHQEGSLLTARLVETQRGQIVDIVAANIGEDTPVQAAGAISERVVAAAGKLATPAEKRQYLALMPFVAESPELARSGLLPTLNLLAGVHLLERPELFLVEREALADVRNENEMEAETRGGLEAADLVARAQATVEGDGRLLVRVRLARNQRVPGEPVFFEETITPSRLSAGVAGLVDRMAASLAGVTPPAKRDLRGEAPSFYTLGAYHAARGRNRDALRFLETACALDPLRNVHAEMLLNLLALNARGPSGPATNAVPLDMRLDLLWRAVCVADATGSRCFTDTTPAAGTLVEALGDARSHGLSSEPGRQAARVRALLRDHLRRTAGLTGALSHPLARVAYADAEDAWFAEAVAQIEKSGHNWHRFSELVCFGFAPQDRWQSHLEDLKRTRGEGKPRAFAEMGLFELARQTPGAKTRLLDWLLEDPVERCADIEFDGSAGEGLFCELIVTRPVPEWGSLLKRLVLEPFERNPRFNPYVKTARGVWEGRRAKALAEGRWEEAAVILEYQHALLDALDRAVAANRVHPHLGGTYTVDRNTLRFQLTPELPAAGAPEAAAAESCPVLGEAGIPGARLLFDSRAGAPPGVLGARTLHDGERLWCALATEGGLALRSLSADGRNDARLDLRVSGRGRAPRQGDVPVHLALGRADVFVADTRHVFRVAAGAVPGVLDALPPMSAWPGMPPETTESEPAVTSLVAGPDALYIGVADIQADPDPAPFLRSGALYRWTPGMAAPGRIASSDVVAAGPLNDCLPYAVEDGVAHPDGESVLFFLRGNANGEQPPEIRWRRAPPRVAATDVLKPTDPQAGQRAGVWRFTPAAGTWTRLNARFPYPRLLRAWKAPSVATAFPVTLFTQPRDPVEFNTVAVRVAPPDNREKSHPRDMPWPEFIGVPVPSGRYVIARTGPDGEVLREMARVTLPSRHRWLEGGRAPGGALLPLLEQDRLRVWLVPLAEKESP